jgi:hypothetical protein
MVIEVLIAGYDPNARSQFDQLYQYVVSHPSTRIKYLMAWAQNKNFKNVGNDSAVDGDIDVAYALLLAYEQWGDSRYKAFADSTLTAINSQELDIVNLRLIRGNASVPSDGFGYHVIRMSDFMPAELRAFYNYSGQQFWLDLLNKNYERYKIAQEAFSKKFGLFPDYIEVSADGTLSLIPIDIPMKVLKAEGINDGGDRAKDNPRGRLDGFNSCRVPWRIATDYLLNSDPTAKKILDKLNNGIRNYSADYPCYLANVLIPDDVLSQTEHLKYVEKAAGKHSADLSTIGPSFT